MKKWIIWCAWLMLLGVGIVGCAADNDADDTGNPWDGTDDSDSESDTGNYVCISDEPVDIEACGPYPEHDNEMWDLFAVVPNTSLKAYYDRDCDGEPEETTMRMYEDVYCQRDKIKSLALIVGSNCGSPEEGNE